MRNFIETSVILSVALGLAWGLANFWCMARLVRCASEGRRGWGLAGWITLKLFGLYAVAAWLLIGLRIPAIGWLIGFTLSLMAVGLKARSLPDGTR